MSARRSYHFVAAHRDRQLEKAFGLRADALVFDLEDAVPLSEKVGAVQKLNGLFSRAGERAHCFIRVPSSGANQPPGVLELLHRFPWLGVVVPKVTAPVDLRDLGLAHRSIILLIEDLSAVASVERILDSDGLVAVGLGLEDLLAPFPFKRNRMVALVQAVRTRVAIAAHARGIQPIDSISLDLLGTSELEGDCGDAISSGMTGKFTIHPSQIAAVNRCFSPNSDEIDYASAVLSEVGHEIGGYQRSTDGSVVSPVAVKKARSIMEAILERRAE